MENQIPCLPYEKLNGVAAWLGTSVASDDHEDPDEARHRPLMYCVSTSSSAVIRSFEPLNGVADDLPV